MVNGYAYKPLTYYPLVFITTTAFWVAAAWAARNDGGDAPVLALLLAGLVSPFVISTAMIVASGERKLLSDFIRKLFDPRLIDFKTLGGATLIMFVVVQISVLLSLPLGGSTSQLALAEGFSFSVGAMPVLMLLMAAALFEELGWRGYAFDSLQSRYNLLSASLIFSVLWSAWHLPLLLVPDSYQSNILHENVWYAVNFFLAVVPMGVILSWVCVKSKKSVAAAVLFHFVINMSQEMFELSQLTKSIETVVLTVVAAMIVLRDKELFFSQGGDRGVGRAGR